MSCNQSWSHGSKLRATMAQNHHQQCDNDKNKQEIMRKRWGLGLGRVSWGC